MDKSSAGFPITTLIFHFEIYQIFVVQICQTDEENLFRLEHQFKYEDSIKIIRKQVERYEELVKEQAEKIERAKRNSEDAEKLKEELKVLKN